MDQLRPLAIAAGVISLAASLFAIGAAATSDDDGGDASPATTVAAVDSAPADSAPAGERIDVEIAGFEFAGGEPVTVPVGTEVVWTNRDSFDHTVVFNGNAFDPSPNLGEGDTFSVTFTEPGTYQYLCGIHPQMSGTIVVEG